MTDMEMMKRFVEMEESSWDLVFEEIAQADASFTTGSPSGASRAIDELEAISDAAIRGDVEKFVQLIEVTNADLCRALGYRTLEDILIHGM